MGQGTNSRINSIDNLPFGQVHRLAECAYLAVAHVPTLVLAFAVATLLSYSAFAISRGRLFLTSVWNLAGCCLRGHPNPVIVNPGHWLRRDRLYAPSALSNVLSEESNKPSHLGRWPLRRIKQATGVRRKLH